MQATYNIHLINTAFTRDSIITRYFNDVSEQTTYFNKLSGGSTTLANFNFGDLLKTNVIYRDTTRSLTELMQCNYCFVENDITKERYYYFAKVFANSANNVDVDLELDTIQTYYFRYKEAIKPCLIKRGHLNRFTKNSYDMYKYKLTEDSPFYTQNVAPRPKRIVERTKLKFNYTDKQDINDFLNEAIIGWAYIYVNKGKEYKALEWDIPILQEYHYKNVELPNIVFNFGDKNSFDNKLDFSLLCYPVLRAGYFINFEGDGLIPQCGFSGSSYDDFRRQNSNTSFIYNVKLSNIPPFYDIGNLDVGDYEITEAGNSKFLEFKRTGETRDQLLYKYDSTNLQMFRTGPITAMFIVPYVLNKNYISETKEITLSNVKYFSKEDIIEYDKQLNPIIETEAFSELLVLNNTAENFVYSMLKLSKNEINVLLDETFTPDVTKQYLRIKAEDTKYKYDNNYVGLVTSEDTSLPYDNDAYSAYIANNKNAWLQTSFKVGVDAFKGNYGEAGAGLVSELMRYDNLKNAPSTISNTQGNVLFNSLVTDYGLYYEYYRAFENDIKMYNDYINMNGYEYNRIDYIGNYDNIRQAFNHIEATIDIIDAPLKNDIKEDIKTRLANITFFNNDNYNYKDKNVELEVINNGSI